MASKVISFRLSELEIQALSALQISEDESLNQTAARLLRGILGTSTDVSTVSTSVDIREIVRQEVEVAISQVKGEVDKRLGELAA
ncbi:hypothetical protein [Fischerella sp. JS2]|uniref:hypothetical protein n=1 Tax=Fischerella sp. JS2 TaxID=2597771 RepID=UPI0028E81A03|nr:hypothetical protein [Fischerella sp. JS2]